MPCETDQLTLKVHSISCLNSQSFNTNCIKETSSFWPKINSENISWHQRIWITLTKRYVHFFTLLSSSQLTRALLLTSQNIQLTRHMANCLQFMGKTPQMQISPFIEITLFFNIYFHFRTSCYFGHLFHAPHLINSGLWYNITHQGGIIPELISPTEYGFSVQNRHQQGKNFETFHSGVSNWNRFHIFYTIFIFFKPNVRPIFIQAYLLQFFTFVIFNLSYDIS